MHFTEVGIVQSTVGLNCLKLHSKLHRNLTEGDKSELVLLSESTRQIDIEIAALGDVDVNSFYSSVIELG